jgi:hypothetical protein
LIGMRRPGTVLVVTEAGQTIGFDPAGPLRRGRICRGRSRPRRRPAGPLRPAAGGLQDARSLLGCRHTAPRTYGPGGEKGGTGIRIWMASYPQA